MKGGDNEIMDKENRIDDNKTVEESDGAADR